jgi:signal transduction histidine kinase
MCHLPKWPVCDGAAFIPADLYGAVEPIGGGGRGGDGGIEVGAGEGILAVGGLAGLAGAADDIPRVFPRGRGPPVEHRSVDRAIPLHFQEDFEGLRAVGDLIAAVDVFFHRALVAAGFVLGADVADRAVGSYRFEVETSIGNGLWSARPAEVAFLIAPFFYQTIWFKGALGMAVIGIAASAAAFRERRIARRRTEAMERKQALDAERSRIARDLHDDVGAGLTQIALQSQLIERNLAEKPERAASWLGEIFRNAKSMTRALDEIVWAVNPEQDTLENFILFLGTLMQDLAEASGLRSRFDVPETIPEMPMPAAVRHHLYLAAKEILHNVVKHAEACQVTLRVRMENDQLSITISDDGKGFVETPGSPGADGLGNMRSRLEQIHGTCTRTSHQGAGTSVNLSVPMTRMHA